MEAIVCLLTFFITVTLTVGAIRILFPDAFSKVYTNPVYEESFEGLMVILALIINTELEEYDKELLVGERPITNQNFDAFYFDITSKIIANLSKELIQALTFYTTEDNVYRIIARRTKVYLRGKVNGYTETTTEED